MTELGRRTQFVAIGAATIVVLLVAGATAIGLKLPGVGVLDRFPDRTRLDYRSRYIGRFAPLREAFVEARLGGPAVAPTARPALSEGTAVGNRPVVKVDHPATNDSFADAYTLTTVPITVRTSTARATRESGEPRDCSPVGGTVWYRFTSSRDATLIADTFGSRYGVALGVFTGKTFATLRREACDTGPTGNAQVALRVRGGVAHYFQITGLTGGGALIFSLQPVGATHQIDRASTGATSPIPAGDGPAVSRDGRYVAFVTTPEQRAEGCPEDRFCHFVTDLVVRRATVVAVSEGGAQPPPRWPDMGFDLSSDGRYVAFTSNDSNLVPGDTNGTNDVFVVDRTIRRIERVSVSSTGAEARVDPVLNNQTRTGSALSLSGSLYPSISSDGRFVAFNSDANNLSPRATDGRQHTYVHDRVTRRTELVSIHPDGRVITGHTRYGRAISGSGRYVLFGSYVRDRVRGVTTELPGGLGVASPVISEDGRKVAFMRNVDGLAYVYVYDVRTKRVMLASVSSDGTRHGSPVGSGPVAPGTSSFPRVSISSDGRYVAFDSYSPDLVPRDTNGVDDVFVHDLRNRTTTLVSLAPDGSQMSADSYQASISGDGRVVAFLNDTSDRNAFVHTSVVAGRP
jgi:Tol biopolymer transport system component